MTLRDQKVALITGGASGLGAELARQLSRQATVVYLADVNRELGQRVADEILAEGGSAHVLHVDVADQDAMQFAVTEVVNRHGQLDVMINNAGYSANGEIQDVSAEEWHRITGVNFLGVVHGSQAAYAVMRTQGHGHIVNIASVFGLVSAPTAAAYVATKHAVVGYTRALQYEAETYGIRIHLVCPGFIDTPLFTNAQYFGVDKDTMLDNFKVPLMPVDQAARRILKGVKRGRRHIIFPWSVVIYRWFYRHCHWLLRWVYRRALKDHRSLKNRPRDAEGPSMSRGRADRK